MECCTECGSYKMLKSGDKDYSKIICVIPECDCHATDDVHNEGQTVYDPNEPPKEW